MLTNENIIANMVQVTEWTLPLTDSENKVILCPVPLSNLFVFSVHMLGFFSDGWRTILVVNPDDLNQVIQPMKKHKP